LSMEERMALYRKKYGQPRQDKMRQGDTSTKPRPSRPPRTPRSPQKTDSTHKAEYPDSARAPESASAPEIRAADEKPRGIFGKLQGLFGARKSGE
ncbi:MAG TPA: hypothetical protein VIO60_01535, partial [Rectinemataceae bacterium]